MQTVIENVKNICASIWTWIIAWWVGGATTQLYLSSKWNKIRISKFIISIIIWCFSWYLVSWFTDNWAFAWLAWAMSMKIFDFFSTNSEFLIKSYLEKKIGIEFKD